VAGGAALAERGQVGHGLRPRGPDPKDGGEGSEFEEAPLLIRRCDNRDGATERVKPSVCEHERSYPRRINERHVGQVHQDTPPAFINRVAQSLSQCRATHKIQVSVDLDNVDFLADRLSGQMQAHNSTSSLAGRHNIPASDDGPQPGGRQTPPSQRASAWPDLFGSQAVRLGLRFLRER
jgi:hypothetical protein